MTKTFKELQKIDNMVAELYRDNATLEKTKFGYAYKRFAEKNYYPKAREYNEAIQLLSVDNALEDTTTGEILVDRANLRGFKFSKQGLKSVMKQENDLQKVWDAKEFEVEPYISSYIPKELTEEQFEMLKGIVLEGEWVTPIEEKNNEEVA